MTNERLRQSIEQLTKGCSYCANTGICGWDDTPQFCGECSHGIAALNGWNARIPINALKVARSALQGMVLYSEMNECWQDDNPQYVEAADEAIDVIDAALEQSK